MIDELDLKKLLDKYNLKITKKRREYLKNNANYEELSQILSFVVDKLNIPINIIKRHPSILYSTIENVKDNYNLLKENGVIVFNLELYINILASSNKELLNTYKYIKDNYNEDIIRNSPKILTTNSQRIINIDYTFKNILDSESILAAASTKFTIEEIKDIINVCKRLNINIDKIVFNQSANEIEKIYEICRNNNIEVRDSVFYKNAKSINKMIEICKEQNIEIENSMFACPIKYFDRLIDSCKGKSPFFVKQCLRTSMRKRGFCLSPASSVR